MSWPVCCQNPKNNHKQAYLSAHMHIHSTDDNKSPVIRKYITPNEIKAQMESTIFPTNGMYDLIMIFEQSVEKNCEKRLINIKHVLPMPHDKELKIQTPRPLSLKMKIKIKFVKKPGKKKNSLWFDLMSRGAFIIVSVIWLKLLVFAVVYLWINGSRSCGVG